MFDQRPFDYLLEPSLISSVLDKFDLVKFQVVFAVQEKLDHVWRVIQPGADERIEVNRWRPARIVWSGLWDTMVVDVPG